MAATGLAGAPAQALPALAAARPTLLLDIDGTLVFTDGLYFNVFKRLLEPFGYNVDGPWYKENVHGKVDADVFSRLMPDECWLGRAPEPAELLAMSKKKDDTFCELYREECAAKGPPMLKGLPDALALSKRLGLRAIAVTNAPRGAAEAAMESLRATIPAADIIEDLIIGAECERAKPHPDPYLEAMRRLGAPAPEECLVFEDSRSGIKAGVAAGVPVVGMRSSLGDEELRAAGCSATLADWTGFDEAFLGGLATGSKKRRLPGEESPEADA